MPFIALLAFPCICNAGTITYSIQNYPADQNGATLSGTITTDGVIGNLAQGDFLSGSGDILSWNWTITPVGGTPFTVTSSDAGSLTVVEGSLVASASEITMAGVLAGAPNDFSSQGSNPEGDLEWNREVSGGTYFGEAGTFAFWFTGNPSMGGTKPWVIAVASVPEPSTLTLAGLGAISGLVYSLARKRRARCKVVSA